MWSPLKTSCLGGREKVKRAGGRWTYRVSWGGPSPAPRVPFTIFNNNHGGSRQVTAGQMSVSLQDPPAHNTYRNYMQTTETPRGAIKGWDNPTRRRMCTSRRKRSSPPVTLSLKAAHRRNHFPLGGLIAVKGTLSHLSLLLQMFSLGSSWVRVWGDDLMIWSSNQQWVGEELPLFDDPSWHSSSSSSQHKCFNVDQQHETKTAKPESSNASL